MEDYSINLRGLNEVVFCPKLYHLMYVQGIFNNNEDTLSGSLNHKIREKSSRNDKLD